MGVLFQLCVILQLGRLSYGSWICEANWERAFSRLGSSSVIPFRVAVPLPDPLPATFHIKKINVIVASVYYSSPPRTSSLEGYQLVGNIQSGEINLEIENVSAGQAVSYIVVNAANETKALRCTTLYVLGEPSTPKISGSETPEEGSSLTLSCSSMSTTTPTNHSLSLKYEWKVNGVVNPGDPRYSYSASKHMITLSSVTKEDAGKRFTCTAMENLTDGYTSNKSNDVIITVHYGPDNMTFVPSPTSYLKEENTEMPQITCSAECNPACNFNWTKGNLQVGHNEQLQLENLEASEAGTYRCTATRQGSASPQHLELTVNVIYGPYQESTTLSPSKTEYTVNEKEVLQDIRCNADCYPYCNYTWTKQSDGSSTLTSRTAVLKLGVVERTYAAKYVCLAVNLHKEVNITSKKEVNITVHYGPDRPCDNVSSVQIFAEGDSTSIRCFSECYPRCSYTWSDSSGILINSETLTFGSVRRYQAGNYTFRAENQANSNSAQKIFNVMIMYAPVVSIEFSAMNHSEGTSLTLLCRGEGVPPNYTYTGLTQSVGGVRVPNTALGHTETYSSIHFLKLQLQDTGNYTCSMNNGILDLNRTLDQTGTKQLLVEVQPKILKDDQKYVGAQSYPVTVQVPFYCYPPVQSVTFVRYDATVIQNSTKYRTSFMPGKVNDMFYGKEVTLNGYIAVLTINDISEEDFANYTLTVRNSRGTTSQLIFIVAESIPSVPKGFFLSSTGLDFIWEKGFNGGHPQIFIIQVSVDGKEEWQNLSRIHENEPSYLVNSTFYQLKIRDLHPGTYSARLIAANSLGETVPLYLNATFTVVLEDTTGKQTQVIAAAAGAIVSALVVLIVAGVVIIMWRRRAGNYGKDTYKQQLKKDGTDVHQNISDDEDVEVENPMYVSAGPQNKPDDTDYAKTNKKSKAEANISDVYAVVKKPKTADKKKKTKQIKSQPAAEGDIYENSPKSSGNGNTYGNPAFEGTPDETTEISAKAKKSTKSDDLMYADLAFSKTPKGKKLVIHGDDRTPYAQVDFTKHADPLPDSDTEEPEQTPNK